MQRRGLGRERERESKPSALAGFLKTHTCICTDTHAGGEAPRLQINIINGESTLYCTCTHSPYCTPASLWVYTLCKGGAGGGGGVTAMEARGHSSFLSPTPPH